MGSREGFEVGNHIARANSSNNGSGGFSTGPTFGAASASLAVVDFGTGGVVAEDELDVELARAIAGEARRSVLPRSWDAVVTHFESVINEALLANLAYTSPVAINP